jgi:ribosomal-protein-alanine N-acetyltransferase
VWHIPGLGREPMRRLPANISVLGFSGFTLRPLSADDLPEFASIRAQKQVAQYFPGDPLNCCEATRIAEWITEESAADWLVWRIGLAAIVEQPGNQFIGYCGLHRIDSLGKFEICYMLAPDYWGRGIASMCVHSVIEYVRMYQICEEIIGLVPADNFKSQKVLLRNGFTRKWSFNDGTIEIEYFLRELRRATEEPWGSGKRKERALPHTAIKGSKCNRLQKRQRAGSGVESDLAIAVTR